MFLSFILGSFATSASFLINFSSNFIFLISRPFVCSKMEERGLYPFHEQQNCPPAYPSKYKQQKVEGNVYNFRV